MRRSHMVNKEEPEENNELETDPAHSAPFKEVIANVLKVKPPEKVNREEPKPTRQKTNLIE